MKPAPKKRKVIFSGNHLYDMMNFRGFVIRQLQKEGYQVVVIAPKQGEFGNSLAHLPKGVRLIPVKMDRCGTNPFRDYAYYRSLIRIYKKERPDLTLAPESAKQFAMSAKPVMLNVDKLDQIKEGGKVPGLKITLSTKGLTREGWELKQQSIRKIVSFKSKKYPKATPDVLIVGFWK